MDEPYADETSVRYPKGKIGMWTFGFVGMDLTLLKGEDGYKSTTTRVLGSVYLVIYHATIKCYIPIYL